MGGSLWDRRLIFYRRGYRSSIRFPLFVNNAPGIGVVFMGVIEWDLKRASSIFLSVWYAGQLFL